mgnify:CR=1 FL=1
MEFTIETTSIIATDYQYMMRCGWPYYIQQKCSGKICCSLLKKTRVISIRNDLKYQIIPNLILCHYRVTLIMFKRIHTYIIHSSFAITNFDIQLYTIILYIIRSYNTNLSNKYMKLCTSSFYLFVKRVNTTLPFK